MPILDGTCTPSFCKSNSNLGSGSETGPSISVLFKHCAFSSVDFHGNCILQMRLTQSAPTASGLKRILGCVVSFQKVLANNGHGLCNVQTELKLMVTLSVGLSTC